ncbi:hypothetical protein ACFE04_006456 [Oxalis oulophora]
MGRRKFRLAWIEDHNARKASLRKRREGLKKIVQELSILCGVDAGVIVFSPGEQQPIVWPEFQAIRDIFNRYMDIPDMYRDLNGRNTEVNLQKLLGKLYEMVIKLRSRNDTAALSLLSYQIEQGSREAASLEMNELNAMLAWAPEKLAEINKFLEEAGGAEVEGLASNQAAGGADATLDDQDRDSWYLNLMSQRNIVAQSSAVVAGVNIGSGTNNSDQASQAAGTDATINDPAPAWFLNIVNQSSNVAGSSTGAGQGLNVNVISQAPAYEYVGTLNTPHSELMNSSANVAGSSTQGSGGTGAQGPKEWEEFEEGLDCVADLFEEYMKSLSLSKP